MKLASSIKIVIKFYELVKINNISSIQILVPISFVTRPKKIKLKKNNTWHLT